MILIDWCKRSSIFDIFWSYAFPFYIRLYLLNFKWFLIFIFLKNICWRIDASAALNFFIIVLSLLFKYLIHILNILRINIKTLLLFILDDWALFIFILTGFISNIIFFNAFQVYDWWKICLSFFFFFYQYFLSVVIFLFL